MSSTEATETHFVVEQGAYAPRDIPDLEVTDGAISASRRVEAPSRHRRDSCPSHDDVGGFLYEFEAVRTESSDAMLRAGSNRVISSYVKQLRLEMNSGSMKYADWLAELIKADSVPPVPSDPDQAALLAAKAAKFGVRSPRFDW